MQKYVAVSETLLEQVSDAHLQHFSEIDAPIFFETLSDICAFLELFSASHLQHFSEIDAPMFSRTLSAAFAFFKMFQEMLFKFALAAWEIY